MEGGNRKWAGADDSFEAAGPKAGGCPPGGGGEESKQLSHQRAFSFKERSVTFSPEWAIASPRKLRPRGARGQGADSLPIAANDCVKLTVGLGFGRLLWPLAKVYGTKPLWVCWARCPGVPVLPKAFPRGGVRASVTEPFWRLRAGSRL